MPKRKLTEVTNAEAQFVRKSEVPQYLREGHFFKSLSDEDDEQISVPGNTLKNDKIINDIIDLEHLLCSLRFWGVGDVLEEVVLFCLSSQGIRCEHVWSPYEEQFPYIATLHKILHGEKNMKAKIAIASGDLDLVRTLHSHKMFDFSDGCISAAKMGQANILHYLHEQGGILSARVLSKALCFGSVACLKYLRAQGVRWPNKALVNTLWNGHYDCFLHARQIGCEWEVDNQLQLGAFLSNDDKYVEALKFAIQHGGYPVSEVEALAAVQNGAIACLKVLHEANCPLAADLCFHASVMNELQCLQYLHESGCPWDEQVVISAIFNDFLEILQYAHQQGCPVPASGTMLAADRGYLRILQYFHETVGLPWDDTTCVAAASNGHLNCLQYAHEHGCPWGAEVCTAAAAVGSLECLQYAHEQGCPVTSQALTFAQQRENKDCAHYIEQNVRDLLAV